MQVGFQDPYSSLNPRLTVRDIIAEPLINFGLAAGAELERQVTELAQKVGLRARRSTAIRTKSQAGRPSASASPGALARQT